MFNLNKTALEEFFSLFETVPLSESVLKHIKESGESVEPNISYYVDLRDFMSGSDIQEAEKLLEDYKYNDKEIILMAKEGDFSAINAIMIYCSGGILKAFSKSVHGKVPRNKQDSLLEDYFFKVKEFLLSRDFQNPLEYFDVSIYKDIRDRGYFFLSKLNFFMQRLSVISDNLVKKFFEENKKSKDTLSLNHKVSPSSEEELIDFISDEKKYYTINDINELYHKWVEVSKSLDDKLLSILLLVLENEDMTIDELVKKAGISRAYFFKLRGQMQEIVSSILSPSEFYTLTKNFSISELATALIA